MRDLTLLQMLKVEYNALLSGYHHRKGRIRRARRRLDKALSLNAHPHHYLIAFDALLMIGESRFGEARNRFRECLSTLPEKMDLEAVYVSYFCQLWLSISDPCCSYDELEELWEKASSLDVGFLADFYLRLAPKASLFDIFGSRPHMAGRARMPETKGGMTGATMVSFESGFDVR